MGSGRFSLTTPHGGLAVLAAYTPGAGSSYWTFGETYLAAFAPDIADDPDQVKAQAGRFVLPELARRPRFHLVRMFAAGTNSLQRSDADGLFTSIGSHEAMPLAYYDKGQRLTAAARRPLRIGTLALVAAVLAALGLVVYRRDGPMLLIGGTILLKALFHAVTVAQFRFFTVATALALLLVALAVDLLTSRWPGAKVVALTSIAGVAGAMALALAAARAEAWVVRHEEQLTYRFTLKDPDRSARLHCVVREGILTSFTPRATPPSDRCRSMPNRAIRRRPNASSRCAGRPTRSSSGSTTASARPACPIGPFKW